MNVFRSCSRYHTRPVNKLSLTLFSLLLQIFFINIRDLLSVFLPILYCKTRSLRCTTSSTYPSFYSQLYSPTGWQQVCIGFLGRKAASSSDNFVRSFVCDKCTCLSTYSFLIFQARSMKHENDFVRLTILFDIMLLEAISLYQDLSLLTM